MTVSQIMQKMIEASAGNHHDISHFMKVWAFARTIGQQEQLDAETQFLLEATAIVHDIACPLCREKYGNTNGKNQERESDALVRQFFSDTDLKPAQIDRIAWLCAHHHTYENVQGMDYQILLEADYLVNADESSFPEASIREFRSRYMKTGTGRALLDSIYSL